MPPIVRSKPITAQINSIGAGIIAEGRRKKEEGRRKTEVAIDRLCLCN
ncbi:hypothetical protein Q5692_29215 [Microcoleus sp. C2C3]